jgi:flagellar basal-body rod modification protein FlgD
MLTVQLQNQDPLNPADASEFAVQLATFSMVEQQVQTNTLLNSVSMQLGMTGMAEFASWIGNEVRAAMPVYFDGSPITVNPFPAAAADRAEVIVKNADGIEVQRFEIPVSAEPIEWAGVDALGSPMPQGEYTFEVVSYQDDEVILQETAEVYAEVLEVQVVNGQGVMKLPGDIYIASASVTALR